MRKILVILLVIISSSASAQGNNKKIHPIDAAHKKCLDNPEKQNTQGMISCANDAKKAWEAEINKYYQLLVKQLKEEQKKKLKSSQETWEKYRTQEFGFSADFYYGLGGTMWHVVSADNETEFVKLRALRLKSYYDTLNEADL